MCSRWLVQSMAYSLLISFMKRTFQGACLGRFYAIDFELACGNSVSSLVGAWLEFAQCDRPGS